MVLKAPAGRHPAHEASAVGLIQSVRGISTSSCLTVIGAAGEPSWGAGGRPPNSRVLRLHRPPYPLGSSTAGASDERKDLGERLRGPGPGVDDRRCGPGILGESQLGGDFGGGVGGISTGRRPSPDPPRPPDRGECCSAARASSACGARRRPRGPRPASASGSTRRRARRSRLTRARPRPVAASRGRWRRSLAGR